MSRILRKARATFDHYFDKSIDPAFDKGNDFATYGMIALGISVVLAFFTIGIKNGDGEAAVSTMVFIGGVAAFMIGAVLHFIFWVLGQFYRNGVFSSMKLAGMAVGFLIGYAIALILGTLGGFFLAVSGYVLTPSIGVLTPFKIILFFIPAVWWFSKGFRLTVEFEDVDSVFRKELAYIENIRQDLREEVRS